jgi:Protein of unknown function (DUF4236)
MGLRFRQSFKLFPGVRLNLSAGGPSVSFGVPGATLNIGPRGVRSTLGIPGTGLSYTHFHGSHSNRNLADDSNQRSEGYPSPQPPAQPFFVPQLATREIGSASVENVTSGGLVELRDLIRQVRTQRHQVEQDLKEAKDMHAAESRELSRRERSMFRFFQKKRISELQASVPVTLAEVDRLTSWIESTHVDMAFDIGAEPARLFGLLTHAFDTLRSSHRIWDLTADRSVDRFRERSAASRAVNRKTARLDFSTSPIIRFEGRAMRFENVNGEDILIYPGMVLMPRPDGAFALVDVRELEVEFNATQFVEEETVARDTKVVRQVWAKQNNNGDRDMRFRDNHQIPVCLYGNLEFRSAGGVWEEYQFSNASAAAVFADAFATFKASLLASPQTSADAATRVSRYVR